MFETQPGLKRAPKVLALCISRPSPNSLNGFHDNATSGLNRLLLDQDRHLRKDSIVRHAGLYTYQSAFISGQPRILPSVKMGMPGSACLQKIGDLILRCAISCCVVVEVGAAGLMRGRMGVLTGTLP